MIDISCFGQVLKYLINNFLINTFATFTKEVNICQLSGKFIYIFKIYFAFNHNLEHKVRASTKGNDVNAPSSLNADCIRKTELLPDEDLLPGEHLPPKNDGSLYILFYHITAINLKLACRLSF